MNVILIVNDTFRRDHLGCYGNSWIRTPNLDAFAERATVFERYYAASYPTVPNRWDMRTGRFGFPFRGWQPLEPTDVPLAQILTRHGVHTQMIWDTPMLGAHDYNYTRGFQGPFVEGNVDVHTPTSGMLYAFRDDHGQWIAFPTEGETRMAAYQDNAPGPKREVQEITFGALLGDDVKNLIHLSDQYYWAEDLA